MENQQDDNCWIPSGFDFPINMNPEEEPVREVPVHVPRTTVPSINWQRRPMASANQRAQMFNMSIGNSRTYQDMEVMRQIYSICGNLNIPNPDDVYKLFIQRLNKRFKLERRPEKLELLVAVLYYVNRRAANRSISIRDVLARLSLRSKRYAIKHFARMASKVCEELNIECLPAVTNIQLIRDMLDEFLIACANGPKDKAKVQAETPEAFIVAADYMNKFLTQDRMTHGQDGNGKDVFPMSGNSASDSSSKDCTECPNEQTPYGNAEKTRSEKPLRSLFMESAEYLRNVAAKVNNNYDLILHYTLKLVIWVNSCGFRNNDDILDASARSQFHCRKTFLSSVIYMVMMMVGIFPQQKFIISIWNAVRSTFYRTCDLIFTLLGRLITKKYSVLINSRLLLLTFLKHMLNRLGSRQIQQNESEVLFNHRKWYTSLPHRGGSPPLNGQESNAEPGITRPASAIRGEIKYLQNHFSFNKPYDDRLWKGSGTKDLFYTKGKRKYLENMKPSSLRRKATTSSSLGPEESIRMYPFRSILLRNEKLDESYNMSHDNLLKVFTSLGDALKLMKKRKRGERHLCSTDDDKSFQVVTYCIDACNIEDELIMKSRCIKRDTTMNRFVVSYGRLGMGIGHKSFSLSLYGLNGAYAMAMLYTKALFIATS